MLTRTTILAAAAVLTVAAGTALAANAVKGPFSGTVHAVGTVTYKDGSRQTWDWDRGKISALSSDSISLTRRDKQVVSFAITGQTKVRNDGASYTLANLQVGQVATVISQDGNAVIIRNIRGDGAPSGADQSAIEGPAYQAVDGTIDAQYVDGSQQTFDFARGMIVSLADGSLTIVRPDKQQVTYTFDQSLLVRYQGNVAGPSFLQQRMRGAFFSQDGKLVLVRVFSVGKAAAAAPPAQSNGSNG